MGKTVNIGGRIHNPEVGNVVAGANEILDDTKGKKQNVINSEVDTALAGLDSGKQDKLNFDQTPTESSTNPVTSGGVYAADQVLQQAIEAILLLIPSAASALNQLADKSFVNSSIATASATFRGTYNLVSDLHLSVSASHQDIATALASVVATADNNDYCFVQVPTSDTSSDIRVTERYKFNGTDWQYEYDLNNSGFTAQQWAAINSTITSALVGKLTALPTADELAALLAGKQATLTFDSTPTPGSANPVTSGGLYDKFEAIIAKIPSDASANNKLVAENRLAAYVGAIVGALDATFDLTSTDGHVTLRITQTDGLISSVQVLTSDIASAQALTTLSGQVSTNASDIATLQDLYNALQQSAPEIIQPTDTWPVANPSDTVIYRVIDRVNTPPEYYSDYMWNGTTMVLMATYNNAIDPRPKKGSANLVTSGGVFDNIGALDISELNASGGTLASYATLDAAIAAIPSDYQKGGMSIKFVSSVDNTYVQYRLIADEWSVDTTQWSISDNGIYVDDSEYVKVILDSNSKIVQGIKTDGTSFIAGNLLLGGDLIKDDKNVFETIEDIENNIDNINDIVDDPNNTTHRGYFSEQNNDEWLEVTLDSDERVLGGRKIDGTVVENCDVEYPNGIPTAIEKYVKEEIKTQTSKECHISPNGSDSNDGSLLYPFATIAHALQKGYKNICIHQGTYKESVVLENIEGLNIYSFNTYSNNIIERPVFTNGTLYNDFSVSGNNKYFNLTDIPTLYNDVFISHTKDPIITYQGFPNVYNVGLWGKCANKYDDFMFKPVLTMLELSENNTFYFDGTNVYFNTDVDIEGVVVVGNISNIISMLNCNNTKISGIEFEYADENNVYFQRSNNVTIENCQASHALKRGGFSYTGTDIILRNCEAYKNKRDGFSSAYHGVAILENCNSFYNYDDGESSHENCEVIVIGGEYAYNGKAGHAPVNGCKFSCNGSYAHHNALYGLLRANGDGYSLSPYLISNSVFVNNNTVDISTDIDINLMNCKYNTKTGNGNITDLTSTI